MRKVTTVALGSLLLCVASAANGQSESRILNTVSPKAMSAMLEGQKFRIGELHPDAQVPILSVGWPDRENGEFEIHFSDCQAGATPAESECAVIGYATWIDPKNAPPLEKINALNAGARFGTAFLLPADGQRLKKGSLIISFVLPLYGGVADTHIRDSTGGWAQVMQYYHEGLAGKQ